MSDIQIDRMVKEIIKVSENGDIFDSLKVICDHDNWHNFKSRLEQLNSLEKLREFLPEGEEVHVKELNGGSKDLLKRTLTADNPFDPPTLLTESVSSFLVDNGMALKTGTHQRTNFRSRMSANLW